jgi:7-cyano-7-deazaguanine synthase
MKTAVAILSGGVDSFSYAVIWRDRGYEILPLVFDYGQKCRKEIQVAVELSKEAGFGEAKVCDITFMSKLWSNTQLTDKQVAIEKEYKPTVVVPVRNAVFLTIGTAYAYSVGATRVLYGAHLTDTLPSKEADNMHFAIYPDCSPEFIIALETALRIGHFRGHREVEIWSPSREMLSKQMLIRTAYSLVGDLLFKTWSCYSSLDVHCGTCESCVARHRAFVNAGIGDLTQYKVKVE